MLTARRLVEGDGFALLDVRRSSSDGAWSPPETGSSYGVVFVRSGCFRLLSDGVESVVDPTSLYFDAPGRTLRVLHADGGDDRCTVIELAPRLVEPLLDGPLPAEALDSPPFVDLEHRRLLALAHRSPALVDAAQVGPLLESVLARTERARATAEDARRRLVDGVREQLAVDPSLGLLALARRAAVSPYHLSRVFASETGRTISSYRTSLRTRAALERLAHGEPSLARMAADLGFADHAHLTRVLRREAGAPPSTLRELLRFGA